jgi:Tol biopolymer transport system component
MGGDMKLTIAGVIALLAVIANCVAVNAAAPQPGAMAFIWQSSSGVTHIYLRNPAGTKVTQLTSGPYPDNSFCWRPDGKKLAFWRGELGEAIYTMNADGSNVRRLSPSPGYDIFPSWSPDGTKLVFTRVIDPGSGPPNQITEIMIMNADGSGVHTVLNNGAFNMEPRWSPDGSKILFMSTLGGNGVQIYTMAIDGSTISALTSTPYTANGDPAWSPDGSKIAFGSNRVNGKLNVFMMNADGSNVRQLTNFIEPYEAGDTGWSPDGSKIAFEYDVGGGYQSNPGAPAEIWTMNSDGTNQESLGQQCSDVGCSPRWQP